MQSNATGKYRLPPWFWICYGRSIWQSSTRVQYLWRKANVRRTYGCTLTRRWPSTETYMRPLQKPTDCKASLLHSLASDFGEAYNYICQRAKTKWHKFLVWWRENSPWSIPEGSLVSTSLSVCWQHFVFRKQVQFIVQVRVTSYT